VEHRDARVEGDGLADQVDADIRAADLVGEDAEQV
jgi:hypothetical protein